jgi:phosphoserine phosphatase
MNGEIDFSELQTTDGFSLSEDVLKTVAESTHHARGASLMKALKYYGFKTAILSGGFTYFGNTKRKGSITFTLMNGNYRR